MFPLNHNQSFYKPFLAYPYNQAALPVSGLAVLVFMAATALIAQSLDGKA